MTYAEIAEYKFKQLEFLSDTLLIIGRIVIALWIGVIILVISLGLYFS